jgi:hypothetical protein
MTANDITLMVRPIRDLIIDFIDPFDEFLDGFGLGFLTQGSAQPLGASVNLIRPLTEVPGLNLITVPLREVIDAFRWILAS